MGMYSGDGGTPVLGGGGGPPQMLWDSPTFDLPGKYDEVIYLDKTGDGTVQPKLKHWYKGNFPSHLSGVNWMIKTMDKPKIDIESVEQIRNNVKRNYPVKYNFGDLSITFWDDTEHKTVKAIDNYFQKNVWVHDKPKKDTGHFMLRDSILIPEFKITEYTTADSANKPLEYTYYNSVLASFDFDSVDDEGDDAIYTAQLVLKVEGYSVKEL